MLSNKRQQSSNRIHLILCSKSLFYCGDLLPKKNMKPRASVRRERKRKGGGGREGVKKRGRRRERGQGRGRGREECTIRS